MPSLRTLTCFENYIFKVLVVVLVLAGKQNQFHNAPKGCWVGSKNLNPLNTLQIEELAKLPKNLYHFGNKLPNAYLDLKS